MPNVTHWDSEMIASVPSLTVSKQCIFSDQIPTACASFDSSLIVRSSVSQAYLRARFSRAGNKAVIGRRVTIIFERTTAKNIDAWREVEEFRESFLGSSIASPAIRASREPHRTKELRLETFPSSGHSLPVGPSQDWRSGQC